MQNNSKECRDNLEPKTVSANGAFDAQSESRGHRAEMSPVDEAASTEKATVVSGVVTDCLRLNIRKEPSPDGEILATIDAFSEVVIDIDASSEKFYKICTADGVEGFCMKKYIALRR